MLAQFRLRLRPCRRFLWRWKLMLLQLLLFATFVSVFVLVLFHVLNSSSEIKILVLDEAPAGGGSEPEVDSAAPWDVEVNGYKYYPNLEEFASEQGQNLDVSRVFKKRNRGGALGVWLLISGAPGGAESSRIRLTGFQYPDPSSKEVSIALSMYLRGSGTYLQVNLRNSVTGFTDKVVITEHGFKNGFCNKIIPLKYSEFADEIEIRGHLEEQLGYILIDKVVVVVAAQGTSRSFMYSLMPDHWCD